MHQLGSVRLPPELDSQYEVGEPEHWLTDLAPLNVFIGQNNHGKSRLLRELFCYIGSTGNFLPQSGAIDGVREATKESLAAIDSQHSKLKKPANVHESLMKAWRHVLELLEALETSDGFAVNCLPQLGPLFERMDALHHQFVKSKIVLPTSRATEALLNSQSVLAQLRIQLDTYRTSFPASYDFHSIYIPALRGLRGLDGIKDVYRDRTSNDYFGRNEHISNKVSADWLKRQPIVYTGLEMYTNIRQDLLGDRLQREFVSNFQKFISERFFEGQSVTIIPREDMKDVLTLKVGRERERPLHELGDGLQQILIQTYPLFKYQDKDLLLFIEEPELYLHPGLERILIDTFLSAKTTKSRQIFVATHSSQFLDITLDTSKVSIFKCKKKPSKEPGEEVEPKFTVKQSSNRDFQLLRDLGIRNSSVLLSNCTIWVEGITDRQYIRHFLKVVQAKKGDDKEEKKTPIQEDVHYSFVEYGGSNMKHWSILGDDDSIDVERLCGTAFVIADADAGKEEKHAKLQETLGERYHKLLCREIENLIAPHVLKKLVVKRESLPEDQINEPKSGEYEGEPLGAFIRDKVVPTGHDPVRKYESKSGSIGDKGRFADECIEQIKKKTDMSEAATALTNEIIAFVRKNNPRTEPK